MTVTLTTVDNTAGETDWYRWNEDSKDWDFNHRQRGWHSLQTEPNAMNVLQQKSWKGAKWRKERVLLTGDTNS